jgi:hypothetical protein
MMISTEYSGSGVGGILIADLVQSAVICNVAVTTISTVWEPFYVETHASSLSLVEETCATSCPIPVVSTIRR